MIIEKKKGLIVKKKDNCSVKNEAGVTEWGYIAIVEKHDGSTVAIKYNIDNNFSVVLENNFNFKREVQELFDKFHKDKIYQCVCKVNLEYASGNDFGNFIAEFYSEFGILIKSTRYFSKKIVMIDLKSFDIYINQEEYKLLFEAHSKMIKQSVIAECWEFLEEEKTISFQKSVTEKAQGDLDAGAIDKIHSWGEGNKIA